MQGYCSEDPVPQFDDVRRLRACNEDSRPSSSSDMNDNSTQDGQDPGGEGADQELLGLLPCLILTDLRESNNTLGGNDCGNSSGSLDRGEQEDENALKRADPATATHRWLRAARPFIHLWRLASSSKNVGYDSIGGNGQEDDDSDDGAHLGGPRPKRLTHNDAECHSEKQ